jgi:hypothetical protein
MAVRGGVEAGLVGAATLLLIRIFVASLLALAVAPISALVRAFLYVSSSPFSDTWFMRLGRSPVWLAFKLGAYPLLGDRVLDPRFDLGVILLSTAMQVASSIVWGVLLAILATRRAATALPLGLLVGIATWFVNGYVLGPLLGGGQLAAGPVLLVEYIPYGVAMALTFHHYEEKHLAPPAGTVPPAGGTTPVGARAASRPRSHAWLSQFRGRPAH